MYAHNVPKRLARALAPRFAAGVVVTLALLSAACSNDSASRINAPSLSASMDKSHTPAASGPSLGTASGFAALAGGPASGAVTCTGSTVNGNVGVVSPGTFTNTGCTINGTVNPNATAAYADFLLAYHALAAVSCDQTLTGTLAGVTLSPGVYCFTAAAALTGTLTLNGPANGVWIFKIGSGGTGALTGNSFSVVMAGGATTQCPNVYWWVAQAATMTDSHFLGTILAGADITVTRGTFIGDALAGGKGTTSLPAGAVTLSGTNIQSCPPAGGIVVHTKNKCNQGVGNGPEGCDPGNSDNNNPSNDENGGTPGDPGRKGGNSAEGQPQIMVGPIAVVAQGDIGTCNNVWALDSFDKFYTITPNKDGTYTVQVNYKNGTFVTLAGRSPGACESGTYNGKIVAAGVTGKTHQEYNGTVTGTLSGNSCTPAICVDTQSILDRVFNSGWAWTILSDSGHWTWTGHYEAGSNGTWFDTSVNWPLNDRGDITGS
jgi:Ice-binding-like